MEFIMTDLMQKRICEQAYYLWEESGKPEGKSDIFWRKAERQINLEEAEYDSAVDDTFPASDPPANSGFTT